jgi:hypothetical protein
LLELRSADGQVYCAVNEKAKELIKDFKYVSYKDLSQSKDNLEKAERTHSSDAFGYLCKVKYKVRTTQWN